MREDFLILHDALLLDRYCVEEKKRRMLEVTRTQFARKFHYYSLGTSSPSRNRLSIKRQTRWTQTEFKTQNLGLSTPKK